MFFEAVALCVTTQGSWCFHCEKNPINPILFPGGTKENLSKSNSSSFTLSLQKDVMKDTCTIALQRTLLEGPWEGGPAHPLPASTLLTRIAGVWIIH